MLSDFIIFLLANSKIIVLTIAFLLVALALYICYRVYKSYKKIEYMVEHNNLTDETYEK